MNARLAIPMPRGRRVVLGATLLYACVGAFLGGTCWAAVSNLVAIGHTPITSLVASLIWLFLVGLVAFAIVYHLGIQYAAVAMIALFAERHFVELRPSSDGAVEFTVGFEIARKEFFTLIADLRGIRQVSWSTGQRRHWAGRDANDWNVFIRVRKKYLVWPRNRESRGNALKVVVLGREGARAEVDAFGKALVEFMQAAGVRMRAKDDSGRRFVVSEPEA